MVPLSALEGRRYYLEVSLYQEVKKGRVSELEGGSQKLETDGGRGFILSVEELAALHNSHERPGELKGQPSELLGRKNDFKACDGIKPPYRATSHQRSQHLPRVLGPPPISYV